jgi:fimbrial isopeptide formation D2 family protein/LPXTG-motif cell wall-anchored protein
MKTIKKLFAIAIVLVMIMALGVGAFAADGDYTDTITISSAVEGETYSAYKMMDLSVDSATAPTAYRYTINSAWTAFFTDGAGKDYVEIDTTDSHVTWAEGKTGEADLIAFAKAAAAYAAARDLTPAKTATAGSSGSVQLTGLGNGYYLITSSLGTKAIVNTTPIAPDATVGEKNDVDSITKLVKEDSTNAYGAENDAQIGDDVYFKSIVTLVPYTRNVVIHDVMTDGLTYKSDVAIYVGNDSTTTALDAANYEIKATPDSGDTFTVVIKDSYLDTLTETSYLTVTYSAKLNMNAVSSEKALVNQTNTAKLTFGDAQSVPATTTTKTFKVVVHKQANGKTDNLAGAIFQLVKGSGESAVTIKLYKIDGVNYRIADATETGTASSHKGENGAVNPIADGTLVNDFITVDSGDINILGLDSDSDYALKEIQAPEGYNLPSNAFELTFSEGAFAKAEITNYAGTLLPSTGGIGTTIFYIVGGILAAGAAIVLITKKRVSE